MDSRDDLEKRVAELEKQLAAAQARGGTFPLGRGVRRRSSWGIGDIPFYDIALGPDLARNELRGHAKGVIAIGDIATGFVALGGLSRGVLAFGGLAVGLLSLGGVSLGVLGALGGLAVGSVALGGAALGGVAVGGAAVGYYACGGGATGAHVVSAARRDPAAEAFFREFGIQGACAPGERGRGGRDRSSPER